MNWLGPFVVQSHAWLGIFGNRFSVWSPGCHWAGPAALQRSQRFTSKIIHKYWWDFLTPYSVIGLLFLISPTAPCCLFLFWFRCTSNSSLGFISSKNQENKQKKKVDSPKWNIFHHISKLKHVVKGHPHSGAAWPSGRRKGIFIASLELHSTEKRFSFQHSWTDSEINAVSIGKTLGWKKNQIWTICFLLILVNEQVIVQ